MGEAEGCEGTAITEAQRVAVEELLAGHTQAEAAAAAGVTERTVRNWLREPAVVELMREGREQLRSEAARLLARTDELAVRALMEVLSNGGCRGYERVAAARALLAAGGAARGTESELARHQREQAARSSELEAARARNVSLETEVARLERALEEAREKMGLLDRGLTEMAEERNSYWEQVVCLESELGRLRMEARAEARPGGQIDRGIEAERKCRGEARQPGMASALEPVARQSDYQGGRGFGAWDF